MQFVKNALAAQNERTVFQKLREAALAYHLNRQWSKQKILRIYLNTIYFGNGAYGIESAARTYFGTSHQGCGESGQPRCAQCSTPAESALIAGMVASPTATTRSATRARPSSAATSCSQRMLEQGYITRVAVRRGACRPPCPPRATSSRPREDTTYPTSPPGSSSRSWTSSAAARPAPGAPSRAG